MQLARVLSPDSIAVFGGKEAEQAIRQCDRMGYKGEIWPVHPRKTEVLGRKVYRAVDELPGSPDAAYIALNRHLTVDIVRALAERGAGGAVCFASGFAEAGEQQLQARLFEASGDMPLLGPNCYGIANYVDGAMLWPDELGGRRVDKGVAIISMSSNLAFNITMQKRGLPIAYMISLGNKLKFDLHDAICTFAQLDQVTAIGLHIEGISDPVAFAEAIDFARAMAKPVVAIKSGRSSAAKQMVLSHTATLAGSDDLMKALFERAGVARVESIEALLEALKVLHVLGPLPGARMGVMSTSGGDGSMVADATEGLSLSIPPLSEEGIERTRSVVHERVVATNPLDYQMFDWGSEERLTDIYSAFAMENFDITLCLLDFPRDDCCDRSPWQPAQRAIVNASHGSLAATAVLSTLADNMPEDVATGLMDQGVVPLAGIDAGLAGLQAGVDIGLAWRRPALPPLLKHHTVTNVGSPDVLDEAESKALLMKYGVPVPAFEIVSGADEAVTAANKLGYPVVAKALGVSHKTEADAVKLNLRTAGEVTSALTAIGDLSDRFLVEPMVDEGVIELIVGIARDDQFGPYLVVGAGGVLVELIKDSRRLLLPVTKQAVLQTLAMLKCAPLFNGFRGRAAADLDAAADAIVAISQFVRDHPSAIVELDINPLIVLPEGCGVVAVDALICMHR